MVGMAVGGSSLGNQGINILLNSKVENHFKSSNLNYVMRRSTYRQQQDDKRTTSWAPRGRSFYKNMTEIMDPNDKKDTERTHTLRLNTTNYKQNFIGSPSNSNSNGNSDLN